MVDGKAWLVRQNAATEVRMFKALEKLKDASDAS
jgi:hypothetical protein